MIHNSFENSPCPCYIYHGNDGFWCNKAAENYTFLNKERIAESLQVNYECLQNNPGAQSPLLGNVLRIKGLCVLPIEGGLLAFAQQPLDMPITLFSNLIRDPLANIFAVLPLIAKHTDEEAFNYTDDIQNNCYRILRTISNLETAGRIEKGTYTKSLVDLGTLVESICYSADSICKERKIPIEWEVPKGAVPVLCDSHLISEVVLHLIRNSLKYTRDDNQISVRLITTKTRALLTIEDRGLGIKPDHIENIFNPYYSVDPYGDEAAPPSLGLGLSIALSTVRLFGGSMAAESKFGEGTTFSISLPLYSDSDDQSILTSAPTDYLLNRYSPVYVQLSDFCRLPVI